MDSSTLLLVVPMIMLLLLLGYMQTPVNLHIILFIRHHSASSCTYWFGSRQSGQGSILTQRRHYLAQIAIVPYTQFPYGDLNFLVVIHL
jgi:hypothetical protein